MYTDTHQRVLAFTKHMDEVQAETIATANALGLYEGDIVTYNGVEGRLHLGIGEVSIESTSSINRELTRNGHHSSCFTVLAIGGVELLGNVIKGNLFND